MKIFAIGDFHLSLDDRVDKPMDVFDEIWTNHVETISKNWNELVSADDVILLVGDMSWGSSLDESLLDLRFISDLPGKKILIKGNHDFWWQSISKVRGLSLDMTFLQNDSIIIDASEDCRIAICGTRGWILPGNPLYTEVDERIYKREINRLELSLKSCQKHTPDIIIAGLHFPPTNSNLQTSPFTEVLTNYNVKMCAYGHLHREYAFKNGLQGILNGVEYHLVSFDYLQGIPKVIFEL